MPHSPAVSNSLENGFLAGCGLVPGNDRLISRRRLAHLSTQESLQDFHGNPRPERDSWTLSETESSPAAPRKQVRISGGFCPRPYSRLTGTSFLGSISPRSYMLKVDPNGKKESHVCLCSRWSTCRKLLECVYRPIPAWGIDPFQPFEMRFLRGVTHDRRPHTHSQLSKSAGALPVL